MFDGFYDTCQRFLTAQMSLDDMSSHDRLYATCTSSLPAEPLLRALALCSSNTADPCFGVDEQGGSENKKN